MSTLWNNFFFHWKKMTIKKQNNKKRWKVIVIVTTTTTFVHFGKMKNSQVKLFLLWIYEWLDRIFRKLKMRKMADMVQMFCFVFSSMMVPRSLLLFDCHNFLHCHHHHYCRWQFFPTSNHPVYRYQKSLIFSPHFYLEINFESVNIDNNDDGETLSLVRKRIKTKQTKQKKNHTTHAQIGQNQMPFSHLSLSPLENCLIN